MIESEHRPEAPLYAALAALRRPVALGDSAIDGTLQVLAGEAREKRRRRMGGGFAVAALLVVTAITIIPARPEPRKVRFALAAPAAGRVALIGDFNDWDRAANPLRERDGTWSVTLRLKPGRYRYSYVLDDSRLMSDPERPAVRDEFGAPTSVITVTN